MSKKVKPVKIHTAKKTKRNYERVSNILDYYHVLEKHGNRVAFSYFGEKRKIVDVTYAEFTKMIRRAAAGYASLGLEGKRVAIIGETSVQWLASYLAVLAIGGVAIPMDKELEIPVIEGFLDGVEAEGIVYSATFNGKFANAQASHKSLKCFVAIAPDEKELASEKVVSFAKVLEKGKAARKAGYRFPPVRDREGLAEMLFTSGTTGTSKCVMLSQKNIFSVVSSAAETVDFSADDVIVSVLPIHHTYELACLLAAMDYGIHICINDSLARVLKNFKTFKPTALVLVPLFVYTIYKKIWTEAKKSGRDKKLKLGLGAARAMNSMGIDRRRKIFAEVLDSFGGRVTKIVCGGAALNPRMIEFFDNIGISIYEGFGITECSPLVCVSPYYARKYGSVGPAVPCCQIRIAGEDRNAQGFVEGELQVKGDNVMIGYYNNPEANALAFTKDGWFRTGDMAYMDDDGYCYITGRLKNMIVLENGKNVFPEEIEEYLGDIDTISECAVIGREKNETVNLVAIVYPEYSRYPEGTPDFLIFKDIEQAIMTMNKKLPIYKQIKMVELRTTPFEKTTSKKIKRHLLK